MRYIPGDSQVRLCVITVGLPARGKSFMSQKVVRYLSWLSVKAKVFNVGEYRRILSPHPKAEFFDPKNVKGAEMRKRAAETAMADLLEWFEKEGGNVAVFDATNSTTARRSWIKHTLAQHGIKPLFLETFTEDEDLVIKNILSVKTTSPDYKNTDPEEAVADFMARIEQYRSDYQPISSRERVAYIKIIDAGARVVINAISSYLESHVVYYIMNLRVVPRRLFLSRHGESEYNLKGFLGGDSDISERGRLYARKLPDLVSSLVGDKQLTVWTSTLTRTQQTAEFLPYPKIMWKALDELDAGVCDGMTYEEVAQRYPEDFKARDANKYQYRYRGGESYADVVTRLDPIIMELERQENIMIVTHQAVLRCIYAYFMNINQEKSPWMEVPLHTLLCLETGPYETRVTRIPANIPAVNTFRQKGDRSLAK